MFQQYINHIQAVIALEQSYLSYMVSNGDTFYVKVVGLVNCYGLGHALVNCYAFGPTSQYSILIFHMDCVRHNSRLN